MNDELVTNGSIDYRAYMYLTSIGDCYNCSIDYDKKIATITFLHCNNVEDTDTLVFNITDLEGAKF